MAATKYPFSIRSVGALTSGLVPIWDSLHKLSDGTSVASPDTVAPITELGGGLYVITYDPESVNGELAGVIDATATVAATADRYIEWALTFDSSRLSALPSAAAGGAGGLALVGSEMVLSESEEISIANTLLDLADGVENGETLRQFFRIIRAVLAGESTTNNGTVAFKRKDGSAIALTVEFTSVGSRTNSTVGDV